MCFTCFDAAPVCCKHEQLDHYAGACVDVHSTSRPLTQALRVVPCHANDSSFGFNEAFIVDAHDQKLYIADIGCFTPFRDSPSLAARVAATLVWPTAGGQTYGAGSRPVPRMQPPYKHAIQRGVITIKHAADLLFAAPSQVPPHHFVSFPTSLEFGCGEPPAHVDGPPRLESSEPGTCLRQDGTTPEPEVTRARLQSIAALNLLCRPWRCSWSVRSTGENRVDSMPAYGGGHVTS